MSILVTGSSGYIGTELCRRFEADKSIKKIIDGDVIHIPDIGRRVSIDGGINRPGFYESLEGESVKNLIAYASGFTSEASSSSTIESIIPLENRISDDNARSSQTINIKNFESVFLNNGDKVLIPNPGYPTYTSVTKILEAEPVFRY